MDTWLFLSCFTIGQVPSLHRGAESHAVVTLVF